MTASVTAVLAATCSITASDAFSTASSATAPLFLSSKSPFTYLMNSSQPSTVLNAVHKRSGNRDPSSHRVTVAVGQLTSSKKAATAASGGVGKRKMGSSSSTAATVATSAVEGKVAAAVSRPLSNGAVRAAAAAVRPTRKSNVFEQFTPKQAPSPFNVEYSISDGGPTPFTQEGSSNIFGTNSVDAPTITRKKNKINARLLCLLRDDTGEQEMELFPDSSPEAAEQLADLKSYSKLNDEARRKANLAVSHVEEDDYGAEGGENGARGILVKRTKRDVVRRKYIDPAPVNNNDVITSTTLAGATPRQHRVRATVKETGSDSISTYIKSLGQHELLFKED